MAVAVPVGVAVGKEGMMLARSGQNRIAQSGADAAQSTGVISAVRSLQQAGQMCRRSYVVAS